MRVPINPRFDGVTWRWVRLSLWPIRGHLIRTGPGTGWCGWRCCWGLMPT